MYAGEGRESTPHFCLPARWLSPGFDCLACVRRCRVADRLPSSNGACRLADGFAPQTHSCGSPRSASRGRLANALIGHGGGRSTVWSSVWYHRPQRAFALEPRIGTHFLRPPPFSSHAHLQRARCRHRPQNHGLSLSTLRGASEYDAGTLLQPGVSQKRA